ALWGHRFRLSRLQAHVAALDQTPDGERSPAPIRLADASGPADWLRDLERRRAELADAADVQMAALPHRDRRDPCSDAVSAAFDEVGETTALLEQMSPHRAVRRLELAREDLERLGESCRVWAAELPGDPDVPRAAGPSPAPANGGRPVAGVIDGV